MRRSRPRWIAVFVFVGALVGLTTESEAVPAFARKYRTSCQTCHSAYPKLNPFGESFRINGFEWPGEMEAEEDNTKEEPVQLGAEGYKRVFPDAVWPGAMPGNVPLSFRARSGFRWEDRVDGDRSEFQTPTLQAMMAGTLGEHVAFFVGAHLFEDGTFDNASVDRFYLRLSDVLAFPLGADVLNLRFGQFIPEIVTFTSNHRGLTVTPFAFTTYSPGAGREFGAEHVHGTDVGDEGDGHTHRVARPARQVGDEGHLPEGPVFGIESFQLGLEASGVVRSRLRYALGVVNGGTGPEENNAKDVYGRVACKVGGMALDGSGGALTEKNWAERSVTLGAFGYTGKAVNDAELGPDDLEIRRAGLDANVYFDDLNLFGGFLFGRDELIEEDGTVVEIDLTAFFVEVDYVVFPWVIGVVRYEQADPDGISTIRRIVPHITVLYRANVKFQLETRLDPDDVDLDTILVGLDFAY